MKVLVEEKQGEGLESLLGKVVTLFCCRYIYTGKLVGGNDTCVKLAEAGIVYETGSLDNDKWDDMQKLPNDWYVQTSSIESFGLLK
jgi:hypothetical protein